nr:hypothetical protein CDS [Bradyrhizobium sp.]
MSNAAQPNGLDVGCELDELARGRFRVCIGSFFGVQERTSSGHAGSTAKGHKREERE